MMQDYDNALSMYKLVRDDYKADKVSKYFMTTSYAVVIMFWLPL